MKSTFVTIFKTIEPTEQEAFRQYIQHFYKSQKVVLNIFEEIAEAIVFEKEEEYLSTAENHKNTLNALSDLKKWLMEFLTIQEVKNNSYEAQFLTLEALRKRKLHTVFLQKSKQLHQDLSEHPSPDMWLMLWKLRLSHINYFDAPIDPLQNHQTLMLDLLAELDKFFLSAKLKYSAEQYNRSYVLDEVYENRLLNDIASLATQNDGTNAVINKLYLPLLRLVKDKSLDDYYSLKAFLNEHEEHNTIEKLSILLSLLNFAIHRIRQNDSRFYDEYFDLAKMGRAQSLFTATGYFPTATFTNIVNMGCHKKEYDWVEEFINSTEKHLEKGNTDITINMAKARVHFEKKQFDEVIRLLYGIPYKNIAFSIHGRNLLIRAYYEQQGSDEAIIQACKAFNIYLKRSKTIGPEIKTSAFNFMKIVLKLVKSKGQSKEKIVKELNEMTEPIMFLDWLKEKALI